MNKVGIIFPGQGSQYPLMGKDFYDQFEIYKESFKLKPKTFAVWSDTEGQDINETENAQVILFANQMAILNVIREIYDVTDDVYAGFSLGEYSAFCSSGLFDLLTGLEIVETRAKLMSEVKSDYVTKVCLGKTKSQLEEIINASDLEIIISNYNLEKQLLINFKSSDSDKVIEYLKESGIKRLVDLKISGPFHTMIYDDVSIDFKLYLNDLPFDYFTKDVYLNYTANKYGKEDIKEVMRLQMVNGVLWYEQVQNMIKDGVKIFVEVGSKSVLASMIKKIDKEVEVITVEKVEDLDKLEVVWKKK